MGILCYFFLRPDIEFYSEGPIQQSKGEIEEQLQVLATDLGFSIDSLAVMTKRQQHSDYVKLLQDTLKEPIKPSELNARNAHIQSWVSVIGLQDEVVNILGTGDELFTSVGRLKVRHNNEGRIIRIDTHEENPNPTFLQGDSVQAVANTILGEILQYTISDYILKTDDDVPDSLLTIDEGQEGTVSFTSADESLVFTWQKKPDVVSGPTTLTLSLEPVVREFNNENGFRTEFGYSLESFTAKNEFEPDQLDGMVNLNSEDGDELLWFNYVFFFSVLVLTLLVFAIGIRNIFKGKVEWKRALMIFIFILSAVYGWRAVYFIETYNPFLNNLGIVSVNLQSLLFALVVGLYGALAYISWEALARAQKQKQVDLIDALWQRKLFVSETGAALVHGFAMGGIAIGIFSVIIWLTGDYLLQNDSQFGYAEASITPRLLTINLSALSNTWLVIIAQIGFVYVIFKQWVKQHWLSVLLAILFSAMFSTVLGRMIGTSGTVFEDYILYTGLAIIFIYALNEYGLLTVATGWWLFSLFFMIQPYLESSNIEVAYVAWVQMIIMAVPLIFGFIAYHFGISVTEVGEYTPEYEERMAKHLRVEREIEIARESQYKLMPLQPPKAEGIDVYGFFLPSFEVGGDYYDYVMSEDDQGNPEALTMAVVDVSGKAMRAAMPAIFTSGLLLSRMKKDQPADILTQVSEPIFHRTDKRTFITCALARYELKSGKISIANAGHCKPILKRNGVAEFIQTPDPKYPLGIKENVEYQAQEFTLKKGDFFFMYSDGLPEAVDEKGKRFGFDEVPRLIESIDTENLSANEVAQEIKRTVQKFSNYQLADDTTIICLKVQA